MSVKNISSPKNDIKLLTLVAIHLTKVKPGLNKQDDIRSGELQYENLFQNYLVFFLKSVLVETKTIKPRNFQKI